MDKIMLVDGYNVVYTLMKNPKDLEIARQRVLSAARKFNRKFKVIVVFDGSEEVAGSMGDDFVFTKSQSADEYIKNFVKKAENPKNIVVVTKDRGIKDFVRNLGATVISPNEFLAGPEEKKDQNELEKGILKPDIVAKINKELLNLWEES